MTAPPCANAADGSLSEPPILSQFGERTPRSAERSWATADIEAVSSSAAVEEALPAVLGARIAIEQLRWRRLEKFLDGTIEGLKRLDQCSARRPITAQARPVGSVGRGQPAAVQARQPCLCPEGAAGQAERAQHHGLWRGRVALRAPSTPTKSNASNSRMPTSRTACGSTTLSSGHTSFGRRGHDGWGDTVLPKSRGRLSLALQRWARYRSAERSTASCPSDAVVRPFHRL
jgi:hypothetical protein